MILIFATSNSSSRIMLRCNCVYFTTTTTAMIENMTAHRNSTIQNQRYILARPCKPVCYFIRRDYTRHIWRYVHAHIYLSMFVSYLPLLDSIKRKRGSDQP